MNFKYIALNGDNVGDSIGNAIASDNHDELSKITGGLKDAHSAIEEWVSSVGGEVVTSSGDEGIFKVPEGSFDEATIENLRSQYSEKSGATVTIGIGDSMSEASKALIFGKLNDKDQVVEYDTHIDDYIASHDEEAEMEMPEDSSEEDMDEAEGEGLEEESEDDVVEGDLEEDNEDPSMNEEADITVPAEDMVDEHEDLVDTLESESHEDDLEAAQEQNKELQEYKDIQESGEDSYLDEESEEDMGENLAEESQMSEEDLDADPEDTIDDVIGEDLDGDGDIDSVTVSDDTIDDEEGAIPENMGEADGEDQYQEEDVAQDRDAISDMIHANMEEDGSSPAEDEASEEQLRQDIVSSLQTFKENKPMLEQAKSQNPKLYEATMLMIQSMIDMAKKLGMTPVEDAEEMETMNELPDADMDMQDPVDEDMGGGTNENQTNEEEEDFQNGFKKYESVKLYSDLMKAIKVLKKASVARKK